MNNEREEAIKILPIGSVVVLKKNNLWLNIVGVNLNNEKNKIFDYAGYIYPFGCINPNELILFNKEEIEKVIFKGYSDEKLLEYYEDVVWHNNNIRGEQNV